MFLIGFTLADNNRRRQTLIHLIQNYKGEAWWKPVCEQTYLMDNPQGCCPGASWLTKLISACVLPSWIWAYIPSNLQYEFHLSAWPPSNIWSRAVTKSEAGKLPVKKQGLIIYSSRPRITTELNVSGLTNNPAIMPHFCLIFLRMSLHVWSEVAQSCLTLWDPMDSSLPGSAVHGISHAGILEWAAISFSRGCSQPRDRTQVSCTADRRFTVTGKG